MQVISNATNASAGSNATSALGGISVDPLADALQSFIASSTGLSTFYADLLAASLILVISLVLSEAARYFVMRVAPRMVAGTRSSLDDEMLKAARGPVRVLIIVIGLFLSVKTLDNLSSSIVEALDAIATIALILVAAYLVGNLINGFLRWYRRDVAPHTGSDLDDRLVPFMEKLLTAVVYVLAFLLILGRFGIEITALVASLGVAGIAVALAAQETLSNVFGAFSIMTDRPYRVGDRLLIPGIGQGDVMDIGLRSTRVMTRNREIVVIPNQQMAGSEIINLTMPDSRLRLALKVGISYKSDVDRACSILEEIATANPAVAKDPRSGAYVSTLGDFAIEITLLVWVADYRYDLEVPDQIYREVLKRFKDADIDITYPIVTVLPRVAA